MSPLRRIPFAFSPIASTMMLAAFASPAAALQDPAPTSGEPTTEATDPNARELRRVLELAQGGFVREKTRRSGNHWEYFAKGEWKSLPAGAVVRATEEKVLLAQASNLAEVVGNKEFGARRAAYADWLLHQGLYKEGEHELDLVLQNDPEQVDARRVASRSVDLLRVCPADPRTETGLEQWMRAGAGSDSAMREIAVAALGTRADLQVLRTRVGRGITASSMRERAFSALVLRRLYPGEESMNLLQRAVLDGSEDVRLQSALALRCAQQPALIVPVVRALKSPNQSVRDNAVDALGMMGYPEAIEPLISYMGAVTAAATNGWNPPHSYLFVGHEQAYVQDYDVEVAQLAAAADPQIGTLLDGAVLDVRVLGAWEVDTQTAVRRVGRSLAKLTRADPGPRAADWVAWWGKNSAQYKSQAPEAPKPVTGS